MTNSVDQWAQQSAKLSYMTEEVEDKTPVLDQFLKIRPVEQHHPTSWGTGLKTQIPASQVQGINQNLAWTPALCTAPHGFLVQVQT